MLAVAARQLRQLLKANQELAERLEELEKDRDAKSRVMFDAIREFMAPPPGAERPIGFQLDRNDRRLSPYRQSVRPRHFGALARHPDVRACFRPGSSITELAVLPATVLVLGSRIRRIGHRHDGLDVQVHVQRPVDYPGDNPGIPTKYSSAAKCLRIAGV